MKVSDIHSSDPRVVTPATRLGDAVALLDREDVRHLPVVRDDELVGILSDRELFAWTGGSSDPGADGGREVSQAMRVPVETVDPDEELDAACRRMAEYGIGCLPVVRGGRLVGQLTETDVMQAFVSERRSGRLTRAEDPLVSRRMTASVRTIGPETSIEAAARTLRAHGIRHLPVVEGVESTEARKLVAILSDRDLRMAAGRKIDPSTPASALVPPEVVTIEPSAFLSDAAELLCLHRFSALPVVDDERLVGILTTVDVLAHLGTIPWPDAPRRT